MPGFYLSIMPRFNVVPFDFDYTLADSSQGVVKSALYALSHLGLPPVSEDVIKSTIGLPLEETFRILSGGNNPGNTDKFIRYFVEEADKVVLDNTHLYKSVRGVVRDLKTISVSFGIVSTKFRYRIEEVLRRDGFLGDFDIIVGSEDVTRKKPDPEGLKRAITELDAKEEEVIYVGDSVTDAETARNAGVAFTAVLTGVTPQTDFAEYAPIAIVEDLGDIIEIIR
jgi:phosphoglycolate phosphatase